MFLFESDLGGLLSVALTDGSTRNVRLPGDRDTVKLLDQIFL